MAVRALPADLPAGGLGDYAAPTARAVPADPALGVGAPIETPFITALSQRSGPTTTSPEVTITGINFGGVTSVTFGGTPANIVSSTATQIVVELPERPAGAATVNVVVTATAGTSPLSGDYQFTYYVKCTVTAVSPATGFAVGGDTVYIDGTGFTGTSGVQFVVKFGAVTATSVSLITSPTRRLRVNGTPAGAADTTVHVTVQNTNLPAPDDLSPETPADLFTYLGTGPVITALSDNDSLLAGGGTIAITGQNFGGATAVDFGSGSTWVAATSYTVDSATQITATIPPRATQGQVYIRVTTPVAASQLVAASRFYYYRAVTVTSLSPSSGADAGGTRVTVNGTGFSRLAGGSTRVFFDGIEASVYTSTISDSSFDCNSPAHAVGAVHVTVTNWRGDTSAETPADVYTYVDTPTITSMAPIPTRGPIAGGTVVTLTGSNFTGATAVKFGALNAAGFTVVSDTQITATAPAWVSGSLSVNVTVTGPSGTSVETRTFTYYRPLAVTSISPTSGPADGGTLVTVTGTGFTGATDVDFGSNAASFTVVSDTQITATAPAHAAGAVHVTVTTFQGTSATSPADLFTYTSGAPTVTALDPAEVPIAGGATVTLTGSNLNPGGSVTLTVGGTGATILSNTGTTITFTAPAKAAGLHNVQVTTTLGTSATGPDTLISYYAPLTASIDPTSGPATGGTVVTLTGSGFNSLSSVQFGSGYFAANLTVNSDTDAEVTTPAHPAGAVNVIISNGHENITLTSAFTFNAAPSVTALDPTEVPLAGGSVTLTGSNLNPGGSVTLTVGGTPVTILSNTGTTITFTAPARVAPGSATVAVTTVNGTANASLLYYDDLTVTALDPNHGPTTGNTLVTVTGTGFTGATGVTFGGGAGTSLTVVSDTELSVRTPAHAAGAVNVVVTNSRENITLTSAYTFEVGVPTISSVNPEYGPPSGGTAVAVNGSNLAAVTAVKVDSTSVSFTRVSDSQLILRTPPHPIGAATITVTSPGGSATAPFLFANPCRVTGVSPEAGSTLGGTRVTVTGTGFTDANDVEFDDGYSGASIRIVSDTQLEVSAPAHPAGIANVRVTTPRETSPINSPADNFEFRAAPHIDTIDPTSGPVAGGTTVTLTGTDLDDVTALRIDGAAYSVGTDPLSPGEYRIVNATTIEFVTAAHAAGEVWPTVVDALGAAGSPPDPFLYYADLTVTGVSPRVGATAGGQTVTVTGTGFTDATLVEFDLGNPGSALTIISDTELTVVTPAHGLGPVHVRVTNPRSTSAATSADLFSYVPAPTIDLIDPTEGTVRGGTTVTVTGEFLTGATAVLFGDAEGDEITVIDDFTLTVRTPTSDTLGTVTVTVVTPGGESADDIAFEYTNAPPTCEATATPTSGDAILAVAFSGTAADPDDGLPETVEWDFGDGTTTDTEVATHSYTTPGIYTATFTVTDRFGATASTSITITVTARPDNQPPVAVAVADVVAGDAPLDVNFDGTGSYDPDGTIAGYLWEFGDGAPAYAARVTHRFRFPGVYVARLTVMDNNGATDVSDTITITVGAPPALDPPVITSIRPAVGTFGTPVVIRGLNLLEVNRCEFVPVGESHGPDANIVHVANDNYMTVIAPSGTGLVNVRVSNADHTSVVGAQTLFRYVPSPVAIGQANPNEGCAPMNVQFSSAGSFSLNGGPLRYLWEFGDGDPLDFGDLDTSTDPNPIHTYWAGERYAARLSVTDRLGATATAVVAVNARRCPPGGPSDPYDPDPGGHWGGGGDGGGPGGGPGGGGTEDPSNPPDPWHYGFDCELRSHHYDSGIVYRNAEFPITPEAEAMPLFRADWSSRRLRSGVEFTVTVTILRDFPKSTPPGYDHPYPVSVYFGALAMTAEGYPPTLTTTHLGFGSNPRLGGVSGISLTPRMVGGMFRPLINADEGDEGLRAGQSFTMSIVAPPLLEIGYAKVGFQSQYGRSVGDTDVAWVAVDCDIEDVAARQGWTISDPGMASGGGFTIGETPQKPRRRPDHLR